MIANRTWVGREFPNTRWTLVQRLHEPAGNDRNQILTELCQAYWHPIYTYARGRGFSPHDAEDVTQSFLADLLRRRQFDCVEENKGRLRTFLIVAFRHFLANDWNRKKAEKRGGHVKILSIEQEIAEGRMLDTEDLEEEPERRFDRQWVMTLLSLVLDRLRDEYEKAGKLALFEELRIYLTLDGDEALPYAEMGERLGMKEGAVRTAVCRLRGAYRKTVRKEVADTLNEEEDLEEEIRHLFKVFG
tara:strand:- start:1422 stop:2156 length:735 start_codon:yes stop_codon:yes gene_type:complete